MLNQDQKTNQGLDYLLMIKAKLFLEENGGNPEQVLQYCVH